MSLETLRGCPSRHHRYAEITLDCETRQEYATEFIQIFRSHRLITGEPTTFAELLNVFRLAGDLYDSGWRLSDSGSPFASRSLIEERQR